MTTVVTASIKPQPWKNGGGVLRELLLRPAGDEWQVRVAVAEISADGPFSEFSGVERWFTVLQGAGVELTVGTLGHRLIRGSQPLRFDGGAATRCRLLDGSVQALNLMLRGATGRVEPVVDAQDWIADSSNCGIYSTVAGRCNGNEVKAGSLLWFDKSPDCLNFTAEVAADKNTAWWLSATPKQTR